MVANLDHPNIVPIFDFSEHEGRPYLVMKYIEGETLKARLTTSTMSLEETLRIAEKAGEALAYAHVQGVLHRDIKPSNVLLTPDGQIYLADFGLARIAAAGESSLTADRMVGTPQYMSPEQAVAKSDLDQRSDIYSFGVMLYEMVVGRVPFNADTPFAIIHDHIYTPLPLPRTVNPDVSEAVQCVLLKALAKEPEDRFETMQDLMSALRKAIREDISPEMAVGTDSFPQETATFHQEEVLPVEVPPVEAAASAANGMVDVPQTSEDPFQTIVESSGLKKHWQLMRTGWRLFWIIVVLMFTGFCCLIGIGFWQEEIMNKQTRQPVFADLMEREIALEEAEASLDDALANWRRGDLEAVWKDVEYMQEMAAGDEAFYENAFSHMAEQQAWLVAVMTVIDWPVEALEPMKQEARMVFYLAARDRLSGTVWEEYGNHPYALVAKIRHELYFGDSIVAKDKLGEILQDPDLLPDYPEAKLLEAEIYAHMGDRERARKTLRDLFLSRDLPGWVREVIGNISLEYDLPAPQE